MPKELNTSEIVKMAYSQNSSFMAGVSDKEFTKGFAPKFKVGQKDSDLVNWVMESSPRIRNIMRGNGGERIYLGWQACKVPDYRRISRCFKCLRFGHISKF